MPDEPSERLLVTEAVVSCTRCPLHEIGTGPVSFTGPTPTAVCVLGEAPGRQEDAEGAPFVGPAGQLMREVLAEAGFLVSDIGFVNTVSCWPGDEIKTPQYPHVDACRVNKIAQLDVLDPTFVLLVGNVAVKATDPRIKIRYGRGRPWMADGRLHFATYHPAAALRDDLFERSLREDVARFKELVDAGAAQWDRFVNDRCFACNNPYFWLEGSGLAWCEVHCPPEGIARKELLEREYREACDRLAAVPTGGAA
jgi:uracil-DNA glycosylase family 4